MTLTKAAEMSLVGAFVLYVIITAYPIVKGAMGKVSFMPWVSWVSLGLLGILVISTGFLYFATKIPETTTSNAGKLDWKSVNKKTIRNRDFRNERVVLDGKSFRHCTFENVTFEYNGVAPFDMEDNKISGSYVVASKSEPILGILIFLKEFRYLKPDIVIYDQLAGKPNS